MLIRRLAAQAHPVRSGKMLERLMPIRSRSANAAQVEGEVGREGRTRAGITVPILKPQKRKRCSRRNAPVWWAMTCVPPETLPTGGRQDVVPGLPGGVHALASGSEPSSRPDGIQEYVYRP